MISQSVLEWLLDGDVSIQYQVNRDLLNVNQKNLQQRIATEGWGRILLNERNLNGHWGRGFLSA